MKDIERIEAFRLRVFQANLLLPKWGLVALTWGNVSECDRALGVCAIKPSGVVYEDMCLEDIVVLDLDGNRIAGNKQPSSDTPTHLFLYRTFPSICGITHTHSTYATAFAQAGLPILTYGTTHADHFYGNIPCTRALTCEEVTDAYEANTGAVIAETFFALKRTPVEIPACLVHSHGAFAFGSSARKSAENALVLEETAKMAVLTKSLQPDAAPIPKWLLDKHYLRKHGANSYYGQREVTNR